MAPGYSNVSLCFQRNQDSKLAASSVSLRGFPIELSAKFANATRNDREAESSSLRLRREKWLQNFIARCWHDSRPVVFHDYRAHAVCDGRAH